MCEQTFWGAVVVGPDLGPLLLRMDKCLSALKKIQRALKALHTFEKRNKNDIPSWPSSHGEQQHQYDFKSHD